MPNPLTTKWLEQLDAIGAPRIEPLTSNRVEHPGKLLTRSAPIPSAIAAALPVSDLLPESARDLAGRGILPLVPALESIAEQAAVIEYGMRGETGPVPERPPLSVQSINPKIGAVIIADDPHFIERMKAAVQAGSVLLWLRGAMQNTKLMVPAIDKIRCFYPSLPLLAGPAATLQHARRWIQAGADALCIEYPREAPTKPGELQRYFESYIEITRAPGTCLLLTQLVHNPLRILRLLALGIDCLCVDCTSQPADGAGRASGLAMVKRPDETPHRKPPNRRKLLTQLQSLPEELFRLGLRDLNQLRGSAPSSSPNSDRGIRS